MCVDACLIKQIELILFLEKSSLLYCLEFTVIVADKTNIPSVLFT
jgi:hypothetical protein